jgi:metal-responsive CopG/Arc/MetJ family transcriptional regulator
LNKKLEENDRRLASINLPNELWDFLDEIADKVIVSRSKVVELIIRDYKESDREIKIVLK